MISQAIMAIPILAFILVLVGALIIARLFPVTIRLALFQSLLLNFVTVSVTVIFWELFEFLRVTYIDFFHPLLEVSGCFVLPIIALSILLIVIALTFFTLWQFHKQQYFKTYAFAATSIGFLSFVFVTYILFVLGD